MHFEAKIMANDIRHWRRLTVVLIVGSFLAACGSDGAVGVAGPPGPPGTDGPPYTGIEPIEAAKAESCATCHGGVGDDHQAIYDKYVDASVLELTFDSVTSVPGAIVGEFDVTLTFNIAENGAPFVDAVGLPSLDQKRFYAVQYDSATRQYLNGNTRLRESNVVPGANPGEYILTQTGVPFAPENPLAPFDGAQVYGYIARDALLKHAGGSGAELPAGSHVHLYDDVANTAMAFGTADVTDPAAYESAANVAGCNKCHGTPYMKHGYRAPEVDNLPDFGACKSCHYDDRTGGHEDWQYMVDDPLNWATAGLPETEVESKYAYKAKLMNDVHMAHAMEFPYPQSMANCATCHEGKLDQVLANTKFTFETCVSCHPVRGTDAWPELVDEDTGAVIQAEGAYYQEHRAPALEYLWTRGPSDLTYHIPIIENPTLDPAGDACQICHGNGISRPFNELHTGYDVRIANAAGVKYRDLFTVSIDDVSLAGDVLTIAYSASDPAIKPYVFASFYGWDSKHFIVPSHTRDGTDRCNARGCRFEYGPGDTNPLFPSFAEVAPASYELTVDMAQWLDGQPGFVPDLIADGVIRKAEITVAPRLDVDLGGGDTIAANLNAVTQTFDLGAGAFVANYFKGSNAVVDVTKCETCHNQLAVTWHTGRGRGGDIVACRNCHNPTYPGSHVEMASRSVENYVHAIHSFQDFDTADTFEVFDPVLAKRYDQHINHTFPNFTIRNCEACHLDGTYNVPDQSKSMPGVLSASDSVATWYEIVDGLAVEDPAGRNIGTVPELVTGPASRACGGCHRADLINADLAGDLAAFNEHTKAGGTLAENDEEDTILFGIIDKIMGMFE